MPSITPQQRYLRIAILLSFWLSPASCFSGVVVVPGVIRHHDNIRSTTTTTPRQFQAAIASNQQHQPLLTCGHSPTTSFIRDRQRRRSSFLCSTHLQSTLDDDGDDFVGGDDDDDDDIPADWSEDDVLAEFEDIEEGDVDEDDDDDDVVDEAEDVDEGGEDTGERPKNKASRDNDDEDDEELDEEELDLDEDDDDEGLTEEFIGEFEPDEERLVSAQEVEWDEEEDGEDYELLDDPNDPDYMRQKAIVEQAIQDADRQVIDEAFDPVKFVTEELTPEQARSLDELPLFKDVEESLRGMELTEEDVVSSIGVISLVETVEDVSDLMADDPYPRHEEGEVNILDRNMGLTDEDMEKFDDTYKSIDEALATEPWDKVMLKDMTGWEGLSNKTLEEMEACLEEIGGSAYNVTKWLLYDLDFNVSNLILAAVKHNREAPILFHHWYPQLVTYERYEHARKRDFDFTWEDVENADIEELERYYQGFGYNEIPQKAPAETGIISLEDLDEEEIKMASFENWMTEVYNPEWDRKDFDDDDMQDEDNVFSEFYEPPQHPDLPTFDDAVEDVTEWEEEVGDDPAAREYRDRLGQKFEYEVVEDEEFQREFRGHLIIACTAMGKDLDIAERITLRFEKEFGKKVFVETRVMAVAREEDNVFEVWLESYDIDLLHSKKRATSNAKGWTGPAEVDEAQIEFLVDRVRFLVSDEARYSYRYDFELAE